ncbi:MAG: hypothetical protein J7L98_02770 [Candidatus Verstraetearchaeota archaeon]|nr:hypothetical protein [Candidatus Verstraetearchaeota archaeon]
MRSIVLLTRSLQNAEPSKRGLITRGIVAASFLSHDVRRDVDVYLITTDNLVLHFDPRKMRNIRPDEQSLWGVLRKSLKKPPGRSVMIGVKRLPIEPLKALRSIAGGATVMIYDPLRRFELVQQTREIIAVFPVDVKAWKAAEMCQSAGVKVKLFNHSPIPLLPDQAIAALNILLDG